RRTSISRTSDRVTLKGPKRRADRLFGPGSDAPPMKTGFRLFPPGAPEEAGVEVVSSRSRRAGQLVESRQNVDPGGDPEHQRAEHEIDREDAHAEALEDLARIPTSCVQNA